jgi:hypothetical protein
MSRSSAGSRLRFALRSITGMRASQSHQDPLGNAVIASGVFVALAASVVASIQATALGSYSIAVRHHATNVERVRVDSIVHDGVLTTLRTERHINRCTFERTRGENGWRRHQTDHRGGPRFARRHQSRSSYRPGRADSPERNEPRSPVGGADARSRLVGHCRLSLAWLGAAWLVTTVRVTTVLVIHTLVWSGFQGIPALGVIGSVAWVAISHSLNIGFAKAKRDTRRSALAEREATDWQAAREAHIFERRSPRGFLSDAVRHEVRATRLRGGGFAAFPL